MATIESLAEVGMEPLVDKHYRRPASSHRSSSPGISSTRKRRFAAGLLDDHGIEVGAGLGALDASIWRIGLMGHNARLSFGRPSAFGPSGRGAILVDDAHVMVVGKPFGLHGTPVRNRDRVEPQMQLVGQIERHLLRTL